MRRSSRLVCSVSLALGLFSPSLLAAPPVLDRIPSNAIGVITTGNLAKLHKNASAFLQAVEAPLPVPELDEILGQMGIEAGKGFDPKNSLAVAFLPPAAGAAGEEPDPEQMVVFVIQTTNYADFVGAFEVKPGAAGGIDTGNFQGSEAFFKDLGGGFVAMAPAKATIERADWKAGNAAAHNIALGAGGQTLVDSADLSIIVFTQQAKQFMPQLKEAIEEQMAMNPAGEALGGLADSPLAQFITGPMMDDSTSTVTGVRLDAQGVSVEMSMAFKDGSATAQKLAGVKGSSDQLLAKLPTQPYLFAMAADFSSPGARKLMDEMIGQMGEGADQGAVGFLANWFRNSDGSAMVVGMPPGGLMSGLFTSTIGYVKSSTPDAFIKNMQDGLTKLNGKSNDGISMKTSFTPGGAEIEGAKVDTWGIKLEVAEDAPDEMGQMSMALPMIFGQAGGPSGYIAKRDGGLIQTFGRNQTLMNSALKVGNGADAFTADKAFAKVAEQLPKNRIGELYIGVKSILEAAVPLMAMANINVDVEIPPSLPPVGVGMAGVPNGLHIGMYMPAPTLKAVVAVGMQAQAAGMQDDDMEPGEQKKNDDGKGAGQPRF